MCRLINLVGRGGDAGAKETHLKPTKLNALQSQTVR